jgi:hypothetical protein
MHNKSKHEKAVDIYNEWNNNLQLTYNKSMTFAGESKANRWEKVQYN